MTSPYLKSVAKKLVYDKSKSPIENIASFYAGVKMLRYEWSEVKIGGKSKYYLHSAWGNEVGLRDITEKFYEVFASTLVDISMDASRKDNYEELLAECKQLLRKTIHYFNISFTDILIIERPKSLEKAQLILHYEALERKDKVSIARCYDLIVVLFRQLDECVNEERKEYERKQYVLKGSNYFWTGDKNDLSELALALFATGRISRIGKKKLMPSTFAREFAAFLGVDKLNFEQDIDLIGARQKRQPGEFLDKSKDALLKYFDKKYKKK